MSGICGIMSVNGSSTDSTLERMLGGAHVQGDKGTERASQKSASFGTSVRWDFQGAAQVGDLLVAADADLWNRAELARLLGLEHTTPIPQLIASAYARYGSELPLHLEGSFALAIYDCVAAKLLLFADPTASKSLYWRSDSIQFSFGSRIQSVAAANSSLTVNPVAISQFLLFSVVPAPVSIYKEINRLEPGMMLTFDGKRVDSRRYWDMNYREAANDSESAWAGRTRDALRAAVKSATGGLTSGNSGAYLSGGTDSSSVVAFMNEVNSPVNTYSIYFEDPKYSELSFARTTATQFNAKYHELCIEAPDAMKLLPSLVEYYGEPFANSSALGSYYCAKLARDTGVTTLLAGDGGDELFGGNERYAADLLFQRYWAIPEAARKHLIEPLSRLLPSNGSKLSLPRKYVKRAGIPNPRRIFSYNLFLSQSPDEIFEQDFLNAAPPEMWTRPAEVAFQRPANASELNRLMYLDVKIILGDNDLRKVSGTAEMADVAVRYPLLERRLAEFSATIPSSLKLKGSKKRYIFKKAMEGILSPTVLYKTKHGFGVPVSRWLLTDAPLRTLMLDVLNDSRTRQRGYFKPSFVDNLLKQHSQHVAYYGEVLWYLVMLELWHRQHADRAFGASNGK